MSKRRKRRSAREILKNRVYPRGAVRSRSELKVGDKIFSITFPDALGIDAISNTVNLRKYTIIEIDLDVDRAVLTDPENGQTSMTLAYRNLDDSVSYNGDEDSWFLFKNYWDAFAYHCQMMAKQEKP